MFHVFGVSFCDSSKVFYRKKPRLDKSKLEVYPVMERLYDGLNVDYASLLWKEFRISISHTKLSTSVSSARFWGLILHEIYIQENIMFQSSVDTSIFPTMTTPRVSMGVVNVFPNVE